MIMKCVLRVLLLEFVSFAKVVKGIRTHLSTQQGKGLQGHSGWVRSRGKDDCAAHHCCQNDSLPERHQNPRRRKRSEHASKVCSRLCLDKAQMHQCTHISLICQPRFDEKFNQLLNATVSTKRSLNFVRKQKSRQMQDHFCQISKHQKRNAIEVLSI